MGRLRIKRIYESWGFSDDDRILVERRWPRGIKKEDVNILLWLKELAPSEELLKWFGHDLKKYTEFRVKYMEELNASKEAANFLSLVRDKLRYANITLLYSSSDEEHNHAGVLKEWLSLDEEVSKITSEKLYGYVFLLKSYATRIHPTLGVGALEIFYGGTRRSLLGFEGFEPYKSEESAKRGIKSWKRMYGRLDEVDEARRYQVGGVMPVTEKMYQEIED